MRTFPAVSRLGAALLLGAIYVAFVVYGVLAVVLTSPPRPSAPTPQGLLLGLVDDYVWDDMYGKRLCPDARAQ
jgi:hypothetical protein